MRIEPALYAPAHRVLALLSDNGFQAFVVGGLVRNALLGMPVADMDVATDALPEEVIALSRGAGLRTIPTGVDHGTVTVLSEHVPIEVTTFRRDVETDGRRAVVAFSASLDEDARRRDFTMNALYADATGQVIDPLGGLGDLTARRVRFIEDAEARIREDYLRILRFFRFHAWYGDPGKGLDADGLAACAALAEGLDGLSRERIGAEMLKLLAAADPAPAIAAMEQSGVLVRVLPGATGVNLPLLVHLEAGITPDPIRRLAVLGGEDAPDRLRLSRAQAKDLREIRQDLGAGEAGYRLGAGRGRDLLLVRAAATQVPPGADQLSELARGAKAVFPLRAADLPELSGPALGKALKAAERRWIRSGFRLDRDALRAGSH